MIADVEPRWVDAVLDWRWTWLAVRVALTSFYFIAGVSMLFDFGGAVSIMEHFGLHPASIYAALTIATELVGSALIISGRLIWLGAGMLGVFTFLSNFVAHDFWNMSGPQRLAERNDFYEHIALIAAFVMVALITELSHRPLRKQASVQGTPAG